MDMRADLNGLILKNPITVASGTFGFGKEFEDYFDIGLLGGISVKGLTLEPRMGNPVPRLADTPMGIINSVGLQNPGIRSFIKTEIPYLRKYDTKIIVNINGNTLEEYTQMALLLKDEDIDSIELNISCPNVKCGGMAFGTNPEMVKQVTSAVKEASQKHLIVKLSPNVTNIKEIALAAESAGANCLSMINTVTGMAIDINKKRPVIANRIGGLSGPAIKPVGIRAVYESFSVVKVPILGMGGIMNGSDVTEYLMAGASAIAVGTANLISPDASKQILEEFSDYCHENRIETLKELIGVAHQY
jgi:dihydroorotate dehydrogenase (NAD+) catalytic subunit